MKHHSSSPRRGSEKVFTSWLSGGWQLVIVSGLLLLYVYMAVSATTQKSPTFDEINFITMGYLYWTQPSNHLQPENAIFAQAWAALPLLADHLNAPQETGEPWGNMGFYGEYYRFFYAMGNDPSLMLFQTRTMISLWGATLGMLIFFWSKELFGLLGGFISLLLFIFCPNMLAHGGLVTADLAVTLGFFAATFSFWRLSHMVSWQNLLFSILTLSCLALAKMSAILILPIFFLILIVRFFSSHPIKIHFFTNKILDGRLAKVGIWSFLSVLHLAGVVAMLWLAYDFQYYSWNQEATRTQILFSPDFSLWSASGMKASILETISETGFLPPAYMEGLSYTLQSSELRDAFLCGKYSTHGWWWFFPFAFLVKTPMASLVLFLSSFVALALWKWFPRHLMVLKPETPACPTLYDLSPLFILGGVYGVFCLTSHLNIGLRHMMPIYPVLFVLAGANVLWLLGRKPVFKVILAVLLMGTMIESLCAWPNYLAFFNQFVGGSRNGYKYLVDSSLDWGQDLPGLSKWLKKNVPETSGTPIYLSYFGTGDPKFYGINATLLPGFFDVNSSQAFPLQGGVYCISASMLQVYVYLYYPQPWTADDETLYGQVRAELSRWDSTANDTAGRDRLTQEKGADYWATCIKTYGDMRLARLCAYLRQRAPDDEVNYSILIYRLSDEEVARALGGVMPK